MRLTLRTLLAYLDDVLEPAETKEIGQKIQESPMAATLVSRIREVMRRRRLGAPDLDGPGIGIDPNIVAQYLDNSLPPENVGDVERVFLESDQQLAEVAACHQILTLALGEPVEISVATRDHMYALGPVEVTEKLQTAGEPAHRANGERSRTPLSIPTPTRSAASTSFEESLPEYLRPKPWSGKILPIAIGVVVFMVWIAAVISDQPLIKGLMGLKPVADVKSRPAVVEPKSDQEVAEAEPLMEAAAAKPEPSSSKPAAGSQEKVAVAQAATEVKTPVDDEPADAVEPVKVAAAKPEPKPDVVAEPPAPGDAGPPPLAPVAVQYASQEGVLLQYDFKDRSWYVVPRRADLKPGSLIAGPEPFESVLEIDGGAVRITLLGDSVVQLLGSGAGTAVGIRLLNGQMVLQTSPRDQKAWKMAFAIGPREGRLEFGPGETVCGIEFLSKEPEGYEQAVPAAQRDNGIYVLAGSVQWLTGEGPARVAQKGVYLNLLTDQTPVNFGAPQGLTPEWLDPQRRKMNSTLRRSATLFEREFENNQPIDSSMLALIRDSRSRISELAVRTLVLTENIDAVVQALAQSPQEETRKAAASGLARWLGVSVERGAILRDALSKHYERVDDVNALYRLLWGMSRAEAKQVQPSLDLVEMLRSNHVAIRELAFANLVRLTNRRFDYRPLASQLQREPAVRRWLEFVQREGALVKEE